MSKHWTWYRPRRLDEVVGLLLEHGDNAVLLAGGTAVGLNPPRRERQAMIDLQALDELKAIDDEAGRLRLGAMVTAQQMLGSAEVAALSGGVLLDVSTVMGPRPVRNRVTLGGNVMQVFRWCDLPVALLALGARFEVYGPGGARRSICADDFFQAQPARLLAPGELLSAVVIEKQKGAASAAFEKLTMTVVEHALASAAVTLEVEGDRCRAARVAVGALTALPQRLTKAEELLIGQELDAARLEAASRAALECQVKADRRADESYRREVATVLVRRALEKALVRATRPVQAGGGAC